MPTPAFNPFPLTLTGQLRSDGKVMRLTEPFHYYTYLHPLYFGYDDPRLENLDDGTVRIVVPKGFVTDFASIPFPFSMFIDRMGPQAYPAVIHDYLYTEHLEGRKWADSVFREALEVTESPLFTRMACWFGVRVGGRRFWDEPTPPVTH